MAWEVSGINIEMAEGDYGVMLPVTVTGTTLAAGDALRFTFKDKLNGNVILVKEFSEITENTVNLELTEQETALFPVGDYVYSLDWYQSGNFMCNIIKCSAFRVGDKA